VISQHTPFDEAALDTVCIGNLRRCRVRSNPSSATSRPLNPARLSRRTF
jgi:hypothetical protein